jgi:hypothetical protein
MVLKFPHRAGPTPHRKGITPATAYNLIVRRLLAGAIRDWSGRIDCGTPECLPVSSSCMLLSGNRKKRFAMNEDNQKSADSFLPLSLDFQRLAENECISTVGQLASTDQFSILPIFCSKSAC